MYKSFKKLSLLVKVLLLVIPGLNWVVEIVLRLSAVLNKSSSTNVIGLLVYIFLGWLLGFVDLVLVLLGHDMLFIE